MSRSSKFLSNMKNPFFQTWIDLAKITLDKKDLKPLYWLLFSEDQTFESFISVCNSWCEGVLPDEKGLLGYTKNVNVVTIHWFRCFEGDISEADISRVLHDISKSRVLLRKGKDSTSKLPSMEDVARDIKTFVKLKDSIRDYYMDRYPSAVPTGTKWDVVIIKLPSYTL